MAYSETSWLSKLLGRYLVDDEYRKLQNHLIEHPQAGDVLYGKGEKETLSTEDLKRIAKHLEELNG